MELMELPESNPVCVHWWAYSPFRRAAICQNCGCEIGEDDIANSEDKWNSK